MPWVRFEDRFPAHPKVARLSDKAFRIHVAAICWCSANLTDGHITADLLPLAIGRQRVPKAAVAELVTAGLWEPDGANGYRVHDFTDYQPSRERVLAQRRADADRQARQRARDTAPEGRAHPAPGDLRPDSERSPHEVRAKSDRTSPGENSEFPEYPQVSGDRHGVSHGAPTRPDPYSSIPTGIEQQQRARASEAALIPDLRPLAEAMRDAGVPVMWSLGLGEQRDLVRLAQQYGPGAMAEAAAHRWVPGTDPKPARYWARVWADPRAYPAAAVPAVYDAPLPGMPGPAPVIPLAAARRPSTTDQRVADGLALAARLRAQEAAQ